MTLSPPGHPEIELIVAPNPGPMTLEGTNTYVVSARGAAWVIDPGPAEPGHLAAVREAAERRGGLAGVLLTHSHRDHSEAAPELGAPLLLGAVGAGDEETGDAVPGREGPPAAENAGKAGPFRVLPTPGHSRDHACLLLGGVCFSGDLILGRGSSFVPPGGGSLAAYIDSLERLAATEPELLCPGHGPLVGDPAAKIAEYLEHRRERERRLLAAIAAGERSRGRLLELVWADVPEELRPAAALVMEAHLEKLAAEGVAEVALLVA